ncbi:uncharacterized protein LOC127763743 isoform X1 [Oryza glaberrima]|uniref:uncharacterized protein LOC127763743 isoform X1 n=1 Tax=Oryza glaberrima TaxID=4538 RepID=UPI00224BE68C|nr:uncharacterized protein LOC127763743 isoform X1 [Oryza glaberrima]
MRRSPAPATTTADAVDKEDNTGKGVPAIPSTIFLPPSSTETAEPLSGVIVSDPKAKAKPSASPANVVGAGSKRRPPKAKTTAAAAVKSKKPPLSPTTTAAAGDRNILLSFGFKKMSVASGSGSYQRQSPLSQASQPESESLPLSTSPQPESINDSEPIEVDGDEDEAEEEEEEEEEGVDVGSKKKLTSAVWKEFKRVKYMGTVKAKCMHCSKKLTGATKNGTKHLHDHLKIGKIGYIALKVHVFCFIAPKVTGSL